MLRIKLCLNKNKAAAYKCDSLFAVYNSIKHIFIDHFKCTVRSAP